MDILELAIAQRIGGADGEIVDALCAEISRLRSHQQAKIEDLTEAVTLLWLNTDHTQWDAKAVERFNKLAGWGKDET
jgi:large-conductance mechanosensitive channel